MSLCSVKISNCWFRNSEDFDEFPQLQEFGLLLEFTNLIAERHYMVDIFKFLSKLVRV